eukprot:TRINITY_DN33484_c0_g1_i1.p1 TRINITY_DN33484_c0_g1~~TRINITY_DN33484_c0_g1_i1.p1  ORF type:complete len:889 (+),score=242.41 TRINITY_DN33484_c0_g1_i1:171-2837(+)
MKHNWEEQLNWLRSCSAWTDVFGRRFEFDESKKVCLDPVDKHPPVSSWDAVWARARDGSLHGGACAEGRRGAGAVAAVRQTRGRSGPHTNAPAEELIAPPGPGLATRPAPATSGAVSQGPASLAHGAHAAAMAAPVPMPAAAAAIPFGTAAGGAVPAAPSPAGVAPAGTNAPTSAGARRGGKARSAAATAAPAREARQQQSMPAAPCLGGDSLSSMESQQGLLPESQLKSGPLLKELKEWRSEFSRAQQRKAFTIFSDRILAAIETTMPTDDAQLLAIPGVSKNKVKEFGAAVLEICNKHALWRQQAMAGQQQAAATATMQAAGGVHDFQHGATHDAVGGPAASAVAALHGPLHAGAGQSVSNFAERPLTHATAAQVAAAAAPAAALPRSSAQERQRLRKRLSVAALHSQQPPKAKRHRGAESSTKAPEVILPEADVAPLTHIEATSLTREQRAAAERAIAGRNLFITGAAGTGKSFLLRYIVQELSAKHPGKVAVTAPTGLAAVNVGGQTLHSFAGIGLWQKNMAAAGREISNAKAYLLSMVRSNATTRNRWLNTRVLVIDEVSMLDPELFDHLESVARSLRRSGKGFGGLQLILCGDFLQLPPIDDSKDGSVREYAFCFETPAWQKCGLHEGCIILREAVRQRGDSAFVDLLNQLRAGRCSPEALAACASCHISRKAPPRDGIVPSRLYCMNRDVDSENNARLRALPGEERKYASGDNFTPRDGFASVTPAEKKKLVDLLERSVPQSLLLKKDAQVILLRKHAAAGLVNGSRGRVSQLKEKSVVVLFDTGQHVEVWPEKFTQHGSSALGSRLQLPLKLGWALTIHRSQGMTLTRAEVQLDSAFSCGQAYVALSRLTGFGGLWIGGRGITPEQVKAHPSALKFYGLS